jgi:cation diffusion facilitator family transporter
MPSRAKNSDKGAPGARRKHGTSHHDWKGMKTGRLLLLLSQKNSMAEADVLQFLANSPPCLDHAESEQLLRQLVHNKNLRQDGQVYTITETGLKTVSRLQNVFGHIDNLLFDSEKSPRYASEVGAVSNTILASLAILVGILSGSLALSTEGADAGLDVVTSIAIWAGIRGGRERISALMGSLLMTLSGLFLGYKSLNETSSPTPLGYVLPAILVALIAITVDYVMMVYKHFVGKRTGTLSLVADAYHNKTDVIAAVGVLIGIFGSSLGFLILDPIVGILVSAIIVINGSRLIRECVRSISGQEVNWSRYSMKYEKVVETGRLNMAEDLILQTLRSRDLTIEEITNSLQMNDPLLFLLGNVRETGKPATLPAKTVYPGTFSPEVVGQALTKLENEGRIKRINGKFSLEVL